MGDSTVVANRVVTSARTTDANGNNDGAFFICPAFGSQGALTNISRCYELFRPEAVTVKWQPSVGTLTTGVVYMGFIDNADMIAKWSSYASDRYTIIKNLPNMVAVRLYENAQIVWRKPLRRRWYNLDSAIATTVAEQVERTVSGLFVYFIEGGPVSSNVGSFIMEERHLLNGLINPLAVTTLTAGTESSTDHEMDV